MFIVMRTPIRLCPKRWVGAWFQILDYLIDILTLMFLYCDFAKWWYDGDFEIHWVTSISFKKRIGWWFVNFELMIEEGVTIVTLGRLTINRL